PGDPTPASPRRPPAVHAAGWNRRGHPRQPGGGQRLLGRARGGAGCRPGPGEPMTATDINRFLARPLIWLVRGYQLLVSPLLPPSCRYYPSCSAYAVEALRVHGLFRGSWLAARRLARCHPWTAGGV